VDEIARSADAMNGIGCAAERPNQDAKGGLLGEALDGRA